MRTILLIGLLLAVPAQARDLGQWDGSDRATRDWFSAQVNQLGESCCDTADGRRVDDPDWKVDGESYSVLLNGAWQRVPPERLVRGTNRMGFAIAWTWPPAAPVLRCFMPGTTS